MDIQGNTAGITLPIVCDTPVLTAGIPSYGVPTQYSLSKNGGSLAAGVGIITSTPQPGANGPYVAFVALAPGDVSFTGTILIIVQDAFDNIIASILMGVVEYDTTLQDLQKINGSAPAAQTLANLYKGLETGTAQAGTASTITLQAGASATNNFYQNQAIVIVSGAGAGQTNKISSYVGASKVVTVENTWAVQPDNTSVYIVLGRIG